MEPHELYDEKLTDLIERATVPDLTSSDATTAMKNLKIFSECRPPAPEPEPIPEPVPTTTLEKVKVGVSRVWDNETTRVFIKTVGPLAGVVIVAYSTIYKDHVIERQAFSQANQRSS